MATTDVCKADRATERTTKFPPLRHAALLPLLAVILYLLFFPIHLPSFTSLVLPHGRKQIPFTAPSQNLSCIHAKEVPTIREGLGAIAERNQLAFFLAAVLDIKLSLTPLNSTHQYLTNEFFSKCDEPRPGQDCVLRQDDLVLERCPPADCKCLWKKLRPHILPFLTRCPTLSVQHDKIRHREYSGCLRPLLQRYVVHRVRPKVQFDAIHYRMGDLKAKPGGKSLSPRMLYCVLDAMCKTSERPIVVVTEGQPPVPRTRCHGRLVLASNTEMNDTFGIMQHARTISVADSTFAIALAEVSNAERIVVPRASVEKYLWLDVTLWTVLDDFGVAQHYASKQNMIDMLLHRRDRHAETFRYESGFERINPKLVPIKRYFRADEFWDVD